MKGLHLKILLSHGFSTFFPFPKITTLFVHSQIFTHLHHCDQNKQNILPVYSNCLFQLFNWLKQRAYF